MYMIPSSVPASFPASLFMVYNDRTQKGTNNYQQSMNNPCENIDVRSIPRSSGRCYPYMHVMRADSRGNGSPLITGDYITV